MIELKEFNASEVKDIYFLSPMQEGLLFHYLQSKDFDEYYQYLSFTIDGEINLDVLQKSLDLLVERHDVLRTVFVFEEVKQPLQIVYKQRRIKINFEDITPLTVADQKNFIDQWMLAARQKKLDLSSDPPMRFSLLKKGQQSYRVIWGLHHIIIDGWSLEIVVKEFFQFYQALNNDEPLNLKEAYSYNRYIQWLDAQDKNQASIYWKKYLENYETQAIIPSFNKPNQEKRYEYTEYDFTIRNQQIQALQKIAGEIKSIKVTDSTIFQTLWGILLQKYNNTHDVVFGTVVSGRQRHIPGILEIVGLLINTIPVRIKHEPHDSFRQLLERVQHETLSMREFDYYSLADIQANTELKQGLITNVMAFEYDPLQIKTQAPGVSVGDFQLLYQTNYDFNIVVIPGNEYKVKFTFNNLIYDLRWIQQMESHFRKIMENVCENPGILVENIGILMENEQRRLMEYNNTRVRYPSGKTIHELFEKQVEKTPDHPAVIFKGRQLTYRELNIQANRLARVLRDKGITRDSIVGIMMERSMEVVIGILGVLKAGGAYLPLDPVYPPERIKYMLEDSQTQILLTRNLVPGVIEFQGEIIDLGTEILDHQEGINLTNINTPGDLAYLIYTSGSTGQPKGVMVEHRGILSLQVFFQERFNISPQDNIFQFANYSFDASVWEMSMSLLLGASLYIVPNDVINDYEKFEDFLYGNRITVATLPPPYLRRLHAEKIDSLRILITAGSSTNVDLLDQWRRKVKYINAYGPTETTICATVWESDSREIDYPSVPIGKPIYNTQVYILDRNGHLQPEGVPGELCVSGDTLARGYLGKDELTQERFVANPVNPGQRMYKTGDIARWLPDGNLEFLGRADQQVKVRGFRIEPGEIEVQILKHESIMEAVVIGRKDASGDTYLCAYIVPKNGFAVSKLKEDLMKNLPEYMIPQYFIPMGQIPLTPSGKVNRKELPEPEKNLDLEYLPPGNEIEERLVKLWQEILGIPQIGVNHNFFNIGGHSLKAATLVSRIHKELNVKVPLEKIFEHKTIRQLSSYISSLQESTYDSIKKVEKRDYYPTSSAQKRLYVINEFYNANTNYNITSTMIIEGKLDRNRFEETFKKLVERHEVLRTYLGYFDNQIVQRVNDVFDFRIDYWEQEEIDIEKTIKKFVRPFDISKLPLIRVCLVKFTEKKHLFIIDWHHIISDGISMKILFNEFSCLYQGIELPEPKIQYKDFAIWQNDMLNRGVLEKQESYWINVFQGEIPILNLPLDFARTEKQNFEGDRITFQLNKEITDKLKQLAVKTETTLYMALLAIYNTLLFKYTGQEDIIVGSPVAGRTHIDLENVIGMFVNILAMRNFPQSTKTFRRFLEELRNNAIQAFGNQDYPFDQLIFKLKLERSFSRNPLFDTLFALQNNEDFKIKVKDLDFSVYEFEYETDKFDFMLEGTEVDGEIRFIFGFCKKLFRKETVEKMAVHYLNIVAEILKNPDVKLKDIDILTEEEKKRILFDFNATDAKYPKEETIQSLFEKQVQKSPYNTALVFEDTKLTYDQLNKKANQLARFLRGSGTQPDSIVGIMMERSPEMIVAALAILKAGGAYLPLDPAYPRVRIERMLNDSSAKILLTQNHLAGKIEFAGEIFNIENGAIYAEDDSNLEIINQPHNLSYIIFTSGTTGTPKGVMIQHYNVVRLFFNDKIRFDFNENDVWTMFHSFCFDFSVWEMYGALLYGGKLVIVPKLTAQDTEQFLQLLKKEKVTVLNQTPTAFDNLANLETGTTNKELYIRYVIFGGEALKPCKLVNWNKKYPGMKLINMYGITETTVHVTFKEITRQDIESNISNIGRPIPTLTTYIMDSNLKLAPIGVAGELCVGGDGVGRGYINDLELTNKKFIQNPYKLGERLYRSGDLAKLLINGEMEYLGRIDHQVKIRGFRVELGEIESQLLKHELIDKVKVVDITDSTGNTYLCAYIVTKKELTVSILREYLLKELPDYMVPAYFRKIKEFPLTQNGKIDTKALLENSYEISTGMNYSPPRTEVEEILVKIWSEVLGQEKIGINDNFFDLGGDSIKLINIVSKMAMDFEINPGAIYQHQTIKSLSEHIPFKKDNLKIRLDRTKKILEKGCPNNAGNNVKEIEYKSRNQKYLEINVNELENLSAILLTGSTGYLGIHLLNELLKDTPYNIYLLIRGDSELDSLKRLIRKFEFYFGNNSYEQYSKRVFVLNGDLTKECFGLSMVSYLELAGKIDCIINSAANVKHYGHYNVFYESNVKGTERLKEFALTGKNKILNHISTIGVGSGAVTQPEDLFTEYNSNLKSEMDNPYIQTKIEAENLLLDARKGGLNLNIYRVGNLVAHSVTGNFQENITDNAFYMLFKAFIKIGMIPLLSHKTLDFSYIDYVSKAIRILFDKKNLQNEIHHVYNPNHSSWAELGGFLNQLGFDLKVVPVGDFMEFLVHYYLDEGLRPYIESFLLQFQVLENSNDINLNLSCEKTSLILKRLNFKWNPIDDNYIRNMIDYCRKVNFL